MILSPLQQLILVSIALGCAVMVIIGLISIRWVVYNQSRRPRLAPLGNILDLTNRGPIWTLRSLMVTTMEPLPLGANLPLCVRHD